MLGGRLSKGTRALVVSGLCAGALAGCGGDPGSTLGNLMAFNSTKAPPMPAQSQAAVHVTCPEVNVQDGVGTVRIYAGASQSSESVRYQFGISDTARECDVTGNQIAIKVGVSGRLLIGPVGTPGTYSVPLRIAIKREGADGAIVSKLYEIKATIPPGQTGADYTMVSDPLMVPLVSEDADQDYDILVGFDQGGHAEAPSRKVHRRKHR